MVFMKPGASMVVFSDVDRVLRAPHTQAFTMAADVLKRLAGDNAALVLCSGRTRAELTFIQQRLDITHPFVCEHGGAVIIPDGYFDLDIPKTRSVAGCQVVEFGRPYPDVVDVLHRTADRLRIEMVSFSDMSIEEVARECQLPLLEARLAKLREYEEPFRLINPMVASRSRLFKALAAASLRGREGRRFDRVGAPVDSSVGVRLLTGLYRRDRGDVITIGITHGEPHSNLCRLVDDTVVVAADDRCEESVDVVDWAEVIVDRVKVLRGKRRVSVAEATARHIR
jgi:mannosyl-3-phosphoglycerate phosphatase